VSICVWLFLLFSFSFRKQRGKAASEILFAALDPTGEAHAGRLKKQQYSGSSLSAIEASMRETSEPEGGGSMAVARLEQSWAANAMYETGDSCTVAPLSRAMMLMVAGASSSWGCGIRGSVLVICLAWHGISISIPVVMVAGMEYEHGCC
jgi:hypothetical protein